MSDRQNGDLAKEVNVEQHTAADFGHPFMDVESSKFSDSLSQEAQTFLTDTVPDLQNRINRLMNDPEARKVAEGLFSWMAEQAKDPSNVLFQYLTADR